MRGVIDTNAQRAKSVFLYFATGVRTTTGPPTVATAMDLASGASRVDDGPPIRVHGPVVLRLVACGGQ